MVEIKSNIVNQIKNISILKLKISNKSQLIDSYMNLRQFQAYKMKKMIWPYGCYMSSVACINQVKEIFCGVSIGISLVEDKESQADLLYELKLTSEPILEHFLIGLHLALEELFGEEFRKRTTERLPFEAVGQKPTADRIEESLANYKAACNRQNTANEKWSSRNSFMYERRETIPRAGNDSAEKGSVAFMLNDSPQNKSTEKPSPNKRMTYNLSTQGLYTKRAKVTSSDPFMGLPDSDSDENSCSP